MQKITGGVGAKLTKAYDTAAENPDLLELMGRRGFKMRSISSDEAEAFLNQ